MDQRLQERLNRWHDQIEAIRPIEGKFLELDASEKAFLAKLVLSQEGKSMAEKEARALASTDWKVFKQGLAKAKSDYLHERRLLELKAKAYDAEHLSTKLEVDGMKRG